MPHNLQALVVLNDLFFRVKIEGPAKQFGWTLDFASTADQALARARCSPRLILLDLNMAGVDTPELIQKLKSDERTRAIPIVAFVSHVQTELRRQASELGCEQVLARSSLAQSLPEIFNGHL